MTEINGLGKIALNTESLQSRISRRNPEFAERIKEAVKDVNTRQHTADDAIQKVITGEMGIHEGMLAIGKADTSFKILAQVRNKVMSAYSEIMRMQV